MRSFRFRSIITNSKKLCKYLETHTDLKFLHCPEKESKDEDRDDVNGCQGCGAGYSDDNVTMIEGVGPICHNCLYNLAVLAFDGFEG